MLKISWGSKGDLKRGWCEALKNSGVFVYTGLKWLKTVQNFFQKQQSNVIFLKKHG